MKCSHRRYRVFLLIGIAGSLFLCFQFFSFQVLSLSGRQSYGKLGKTGQQARVLDDEVIDPVMDRKLVLPPDKHANVLDAQLKDTKKTGKYFFYNISKFDASHD